MDPKTKSGLLMLWSLMAFIIAIILIFRLT